MSRRSRTRNGLVNLVCVVSFILPGCITENEHVHHHYENPDATIDAGEASGDASDARSDVGARDARGDASGDANDAGHDVAYADAMGELDVADAAPDTADPNLPPQVLRAWYPFDNADSPQGVVPDETGSYPGSNEGMIKQAGYLGSALAWTSHGQALRIPEAVLDNRPEGTLALWLRRDEVRAVRLLGKVNPGVSGEMGAGINDSGLLNFNTSDGHRLEAQLSLGVDEWHHLAFTWSPRGKRIYFDGALVASNNHPASVGDGATLTEFGRDPNQPNSTGSRGAIDEVRIYEHALAQSQIAQLAGAGVSCPDGQHVCSGQCVEPQANDPSIGCAKGCGSPCHQPDGMTAACTTDGYCEAVCATVGADSYESNDDLQSANHLGSYTDYPDTHDNIPDATIIPETDVDWYSFEARDTSSFPGINGGAPNVRVQIPNVPQDTDYDLAVWYACQDGSSPSHSCTSGQADARHGNGCKAVRSGSKWELELSASCSGGDTGDVLMRVERTRKGSSCAPYTIDMTVH